MKKDLEPTSRPLKRFCECDASQLWRHDYPWLVPTGSHGMLPTSSQSSQPLIGLRCVGRVRSWKYLGAALNIGGTSEVLKSQFHCATCTIHTSISRLQSQHQIDKYKLNCKCHPLDESRYIKIKATTGMGSVEALPRQQSVKRPVSL
jgi:hypothetical protein